MGVGTGIGLSVLPRDRHLARRHHRGRRYTGRRRVLHVRLPAGTGEETASDPVEDQAPPSAGLRVLVLDDEPEVADTLREMLDHAGFRIDVADTGQAALELVRTNDYAIVFSDMRMADMDGMTFYRGVKRLNPRLAECFIVATGDTMSGGIRAFIEENGLPYLEKPFIPADVRRVVAKAFRGGRRRSERHSTGWSRVGAERACGRNDAWRSRQGLSGRINEARLRCRNRAATLDRPSSRSSRAAVAGRPPRGV